MTKWGGYHGGRARRGATIYELRLSTSRKSTFDTFACCPLALQARHLANWTCTLNSSRKPFLHNGQTAESGIDGRANHSR